jgi:hypothetical protein
MKRPIGDLLRRLDEASRWDVTSAVNLHESQVLVETLKRRCEEAAAQIRELLAMCGENPFDSEESS